MKKHHLSLAIAKVLAIPCLIPLSALAQDTQQASGALVEEEVVVRGIRSQLREAVQLERDSDTVVSVITADDIGNFPDQNIAESLQRVPGVTIDRDEGEGRFVIVRGLSPNFTQVTVNDAQIGSSDGSGPDIPPAAGRRVALDVIPSDLLSKVEVGKTLLPDTDHDSLGSKVDLRPLSALDRPGNMTGRIVAQGTHTENADDTRPKISGDITFRQENGESEWGVAAAVNYFEREVQLDRLQSDSGGGIQDRDGVLTPQEFDQRIEVGRRERVGATVTFDYVLNDDHSWNFSVLYGELDDDDIRIQQEIELRDASSGEVQNVVNGSGRFSDVDLERQMFFQPRVEETYAVHFGGSNNFDDWEVGYAIDVSENNFTLDDGLRGRFRERDAIVDATWTDTSADYVVVGRGDFNSGGDEEFDFRPGLSEFDFNQLLIIDEDRNDEIISYNIDIERRFRLAAMDGSVKFGFKQRKRDREFLRGELSVNPQSGDDDNLIPDTLAEIDVFRPDSGMNIDGGLVEGAVWPTIDAGRSLLRQAASFQNIEATGTRRDFTLEEDVDAAYLMGDLELSEQLKIIAGLRFESTDVQTEGTYGSLASLSADELDDGEDIDAAAFSIQSFSKDYDDVFAHVHLRYEPTDELLFRFSLSQAQVRPGFGSISGLTEVSVEADLAPPDAAPGDTVVIDPVGNGELQTVLADTLEVELQSGNPSLDPLTANQLDVSMGWYPSDSTNLTAAVFYKDISDPFLGIDTDNVELYSELTGFPMIDPVTGLEITNIKTVLNGEDAEVIGFEVSFNHFFDYLDSPLDGFFVSGNLTWLDSETSSPFVRDGEVTRLPDQPDWVGNLTGGYENEDFAARLAFSYRGDQVLALDTDDRFADILQDDFFTLDFSVRLYAFENMQFFFDAINITEEAEARFYRGDAGSGRVFERYEDFGRTYQLGLVANF